MQQGSALNKFLHQRLIAKTLHTLDSQSRISLHSASRLFNKQNLAHLIEGMKFLCYMAAHIQNPAARTESCDSKSPRVPAAKGFWLSRLAGRYLNGHYHLQHPVAKLNSLTVSYKTLDLQLERKCISGRLSLDFSSSG